MRPYAKGFGANAVGTSNARYGSVHPNQFPVASFRDTFSYVPNVDVTNKSIANTDRNPEREAARALGGCPSSKAVCVSSGYGGEMMWRDVITTDQNILQEDQKPEVEVLVAVFPSQLEAANGTRGWGGVGWGAHHLTTELTQEMVLYGTEAGPSTRRERVACVARED